MRNATILTIAAAILFPTLAGCQSGGSAASIKIDRAKGLASAEDNPTSYDRRGEPSLDDQTRPATWIYIDGKEGRFEERDGRKMMEWVISSPVSPTPTFRVQAYEPLLGVPTDFSCGLQTVRAEDGSHIFYAIAADEGTFEVGRDYSLTNPGSKFTIRIPATEQTYDSIEPLAPGEYIIVAKVLNARKKKAGLAVTRFTVRASAALTGAASATTAN